MATVPGKRASSDPNLRDRLYELLEHDHLPHSVGSRFAQAIVAIIVLDVLAMILASVPEFDAGFGWLFTTIEATAVVAFALHRRRLTEFAYYRAPVGRSSGEEGRTDVA